MAAASPGPSFVVSVRTSLSEGFAAAAGLALGLGIGAAIWATAAILGLAFLFEAFPSTLTTARILGGLFLVWMGIRTWRYAATPLPSTAHAPAPRSAVSAIRLGILTQLANPKPAIFFSAVFAGLIPPEASTLSIVLVITAVMVNETAWYVLVARALSLPTPRSVYMRAKVHFERAFGGLIGLLGAKIALT